MGIGHFGVALIAKRAEPKLSLGTATLAALLADFVGFALLIAGVEHFSPVAGAAVNRMIGDHIVWSHSLAMDTFYGAVFAAFYFAIRRFSKGAWILFALVLSHWILDSISHRPDMALAPGIAMRLGFGLWNSYPATVLVEGGFWLAAAILYARATQSKSLAAAIAFWTGVALLTFIGLANPLQGIDPDPRRAGIGGFAVFTIFVAWAYWMNRVRIRSRSETPPDSGSNRSDR